MAPTRSPENRLNRARRAREADGAPASPRAGARRWGRVASSGRTTRACSFYIVMKPAADATQTASHDTPSHHRALASRGARLASARCSRRRSGTRCPTSTSPTLKRRLAITRDAFEDLMGRQLAGSWRPDDAAADDEGVVGIG